ncbi:putative RNA-binding protein Pno1p interacting with Nob1p and involved in 26S proteasome assembly [Trachipleistophora hominis]|uniref:Pre-rRNA-processing protein PNO1 n=1 Tax=Trachipleistophora hominis TaxID=72359 RepID=L7JVD8_TRAHO|nr:putative RNA-binding protein Pno1p interacting with Nob1p and involved in 26S proteasome assembly [Trachipleistophora hominis]
MDIFTSRSVNVPIPKIKMFKEHWMEIYTPLVNIMGLQVRMNLKVPCVDLRIEDDNNQLCLEKGIQFLNAILDGFAPDQAVNLLKNGTCLVKFHISEIKRLSGDNVSRAIGRIIGREGKVKSAIEHTMGVCMLIKEDEIFMLGDEEGIKKAKESISRLVLGAHPGSILNKLKVIASKQRKGCFETVHLKNEENLL